jgi:hypothetical protein
MFPQIPKVYYTTIVFGEKVNISFKRLGFHKAFPTRGHVSLVISQRGHGLRQGRGRDRLSTPWWLPSGEQRLGAVLYAEQLPCHLPLWPMLNCFLGLRVGSHLWGLCLGSWGRGRWWQRSLLSCLPPLPSFSALTSHILTQTCMGLPADWPSLLADQS